MFCHVAGCLGTGAGAILAIFKRAPVAPTAAWIGLNMGASCGVYTGKKMLICSHNDVKL